MKKLFSLKLFITLFVFAILFTSRSPSISHAYENYLLGPAAIAQINETRWGGEEKLGGFGTIDFYSGSQVSIGETFINVKNEDGPIHTVSSAGRLAWIWMREWGAPPLLVTASFDYKIDQGSSNSSLVRFWESGSGDWDFTLADGATHHVEKTFETSWLSGTFNPNFYIRASVGGGHGQIMISNISVSSSIVPLPGAVLLLGTGLGGLAIYSLRKLTAKS
jgi:hypothetical protein